MPTGPRTAETAHAEGAGQVGLAGAQAQGAETGDGVDHPFQRSAHRDQHLPGVGQGDEERHHSRRPPSTTTGTQGTARALSWASWRGNEPSRAVP